MAQTTRDLRLNENLQDRLTTLAATRMQSTDHLVEEAVDQYLYREEALEAEKTLTAARWTRYE